MMPLTTQEARRRALESLLRDDTAAKYLDPIAQMYRELDRQFAMLPNRHWWERIPYSWGWWWRMVYGWLLCVDRALTPRRWR